MFFIDVVLLEKMVCDWLIDVVELVWVEGWGWVDIILCVLLVELYIF